MPSLLAVTPSSTGSDTRRTTGDCKTPSARGWKLHHHGLAQTGPEGGFEHRQTAEIKPPQLLHRAMGTMLCIRSDLGRKQPEGLFTFGLKRLKIAPKSHFFFFSLLCHLLPLSLFTGTVTCKAGFGIRGPVIRLQPSNCGRNSWKCYFCRLLIDSIGGRKKKKKSPANPEPASHSPQPHDKVLTT